MEVALAFLLLGLVAFGGPAAHVALMRRLLVLRWKWVAEDEFLRMFAACNLLPSAPWGPCGPVAPFGPCGPVAPRAPAGNCPGLKSADSNEPSLTLRLVTASLARSTFLTCPFLICAEPTLFFDNFTAAYPLPPSATKSASVATTLA